MLRLALSAALSALLACAGTPPSVAPAQDAASASGIATRGGIEPEPAPDGAADDVDDATADDAPEGPDEPAPLVLDGETSLDYANVPELDLGSSGTLEFWVAPLWTEDPGFYPCVLASRTAYDGEDPAELSDATRYSVHVTGDLRELGLWNGHNWASVAFDFSDEEFHHVAIVTQGSRSEVFIDGETRGTLPIGYGTATGLPFHVGSSDGETEFFFGALDGIRIWKAALTPDVVAGLREFDGIPDAGHPNALDLVAISDFTSTEQQLVVIAQE